MKLNYGCWNPKLKPNTRGRAINGEIDIPDEIWNTGKETAYIIKKIAELHPGYLLQGYCPTNPNERVTRFTNS